MGDQMIIDAEIAKVVQKFRLIKSTPCNCLLIKPPALKTTNPMVQPFPSKEYFNYTFHRTDNK